MRLLTLSLSAALVAAGPAVAEPIPKAAGLQVVPPTAFGFVTVRVADLKDVPALKPVRDAVTKLEGADRPIEKELGVPLDGIDRITLFWPAMPTEPDGFTPILVVTTREPFNEAKVLKALNAALPDARPRHRHGAAATAPAVRIHPDHGPPVSVPGPGFPPGPGPGGPFPMVPMPGSYPGFPPGSSPGGPGTPPGMGTGFPPLGPPGGGVPPKGSPAVGPKRPGGDGAQVKDDAPAGKGTVDEKPVRADPAPPTGADLYFLDHEPYSAVFLLDDRTLVFLPSPDRDDGVGMLHLVGQLLRKRADGPLAEALAGAGKHTIAAAARLGDLERLVRHGDEFPRELVPFRSLLRANAVQLTVDVGEKTTVAARLTFPDAAAARRAEPVLKTLIQLGVDALGDLKKDLAAKDAEGAAVLAPLIDLAAGALDNADVKADGPAVTARLEAEIGPAVARAMANFPAMFEGASSRVKTFNNLKRIGLAIHNYHDTMASLPTDVYGPDGKALFSWRIHLLPYLEEDNLYKQLDLSKPWDDPRNAKLLEKMPDVFRVFGRDAGRGMTYLQMPTGSPQAQFGGTPIHVPGRRQTLTTITDGTSNTIMVVEALEATNWAKPGGDLKFDERVVKKVGAADRKWFYALFGDGSVRAVRRDKLTDEQLRALMTANGGEVVTVP